MQACLFFICNRSACISNVLNLISVAFLMQTADLAVSRAQPSPSGTATARRQRTNKRQGKRTGGAAAPASPASTRTGHPKLARPQPATPEVGDFLFDCHTGMLGNSLRRFRLIVRVAEAGVRPFTTKRALVTCLYMFQRLLHASSTHLARCISAAVRHRRSRTFAPVQPLRLVLWSAACCRSAMRPACWVRARMHGLLRGRRRHQWLQGLHRWAIMKVDS